jgi:predicted PurR-regulated permease PerM
MGLALYLARSVFIPLAFALMIYFLMRPAVRALKRLLIPRALAALIVLGAVLGVVGAVGLELSAPASSWLARIPSVVKELDDRSRVLRRPVERFSHLVESAERLTDVGRAAVRQEVTVVDPSWFDGFMETALALSTGILVAFVASYFLLLDGDRLLARFLQLLPDFSDRTRARAVINEVERRMGQYLRTATVLNLGLGIVLGCAFQLLGVPNPWLWAAIAAVLEYVPYVGAAVGIGLVSMVSLVTFPTLSAAALPPLVYFIATLVTGNFIAPVVLGRAFKISPIVLFVWLVFWSWLWGVPGAVLAVPMLMLLNIICEQSTSLVRFALFIRR